VRAKDLIERATGVQAERPEPLLMVDIDGVISLFGFALHRRPPGSFHSIDGIPHFISATAAEHLLALSESFQMVWASGWEEKANEYLPHLLGLSGPWPHLRFQRDVGGGPISHAHWKLEAIEAYAQGRALAWIDDSFNEACHAWSRARAAPTLLVNTSPALGLTDKHARRLQRWAGEQAALSAS
jgi:HAD domain in Swiss Army Knife RNA repair proteins